MQHQLKTLKNKLKVLFVDSKGSTASTVQIWFRAGSALEKNHNEGIAHFLEHMFFKGTPTRPGAQIAFEVESYGGEINAFTSFDYTCYYINSPADKLPHATEILLDMVSNPLFTESDLIPERDVVFEEYRRSIDSPNQFGFMQIQKTAFEGSYAHPILGREDTIKNFSQKDLHEFRKNFYNLSNAMLIVAGDLAHPGMKEIEKTIEKYQLPEGPESNFSEFALKKNSQVLVYDKDVRMCTLNMILKAPNYNHPRSASEDLAINCLGYGETSRLYQKLVQEATIANSASSSTMFMAKGGVHFIRLSFPTENMSKVIQIFTETMKDVLKKPFTDEEIKKIKNQYLASKIYERESIEAYSFSLGNSFAQTGNIKSEEEFIEKIKQVQVAEAQQAFLDILSKDMHFILQAPKNSPLKKMEAEINKLQKNISQLKKLIPTKKEAKGKSIQASAYDSLVQLIPLAPGVKLIYRQNKMTPTFVLQAYMRGGLTEETEKNNGIYHLLSSTISKGYVFAKTKASNNQIKNDLEERSSSLHGFSGKNAYGLQMHGLSEHFDVLNQHFLGSLLSPTFQKSEIAHERKLTLRALENHQEDPVKHCFKMAGELFFQGHSYALNQIGKKETLLKVTTEQLKSLHLKNLKSKELILTFCGDLDLATVQSALKPLVQEMSKLHKSFKASKPVLKKYRAQLNQVKHLEFNREQTQIFYGTSVPPMGSVDNLYLKMIASHLSGQSSELFVEVRDRQGLCYSAQPVHFQALEGGYFGIYMASGYDKVEKAILAIQGILHKIRDEGLSKEDFLRIKSMIKGQSLINVQTNEDYASIYSVPVLQNQSIDYYHLKNIEIENLNYQDFQKNIKRILSQKWNLITVGRKLK